MATVELQTPVLLVAMPQVLDPFFHKSVVLLVHHQDEGSLGFIVNRPTGIRVAEILAGIEIGWQGDSSVLAYFGGPVQPQLGTVLFHREGDRANGDPANGDPEAYPEVFPGTRLTQQIGDLQELAAEPPGRFRFYLGYAGWDGGQLEREILRNDWLLVPVKETLLFGERPEEVWQAALESVGIDPAQLPTWTSASPDPAAN